jgi:hypothetical protein
MIIEKVLNKKEINNYINQIRNAENVKKSKHSIVENAGHTSFMKSIRAHPKVKEAFAKLWNCKPEDLISSYDTYGIMQKGDPKQGLWPHRDEPLSRRKRCWQGFVQLTDNVNEGLVIWPDSNEKDPKCVDHKDGVLVKVDAGTLVMWDSKTIHCNLNNGERERIAMYVCMVPKYMLSKKAIQILELCEKKQITTNHTPFFPVPHP